MLEPMATSLTPYNQLMHSESTQQQVKKHCHTMWIIDHWNLLSGVISVINPSLLDRETQPSLMLRLVASDGGANPQASSLFITVELEDINDNPPVFTQSVYTASVREVSHKVNLVFKVCSYTLPSLTLHSCCLLCSTSCILLSIIISTSHVS